MSVRVRDLEIALVLAREMKAAAARSVDASLRLDQLQEVFGVEELDRAERARIQTALQMAGLEPFPSLLEADPAEPIRFGAAKVAAPAGAGTVASAPPEPPRPTSHPPSRRSASSHARSSAARGAPAVATTITAPATRPRRLSCRRWRMSSRSRWPRWRRQFQRLSSRSRSRRRPNPELEAEPEPELEAAPEPEPELEAEPESELEAEAEPEDGREYIPLVPPEEVEPPATGYGTYEPEPRARTGAAPAGSLR